MAIQPLENHTDQGDITVTFKNPFQAIEDAARPFTGIDANVIAFTLYMALGREQALAYIDENAAPHWERWNRVRWALLDNTELE